ncbi:MAG TPA: ATPase domain-containing protein [Gemmatimonadaceae bacterium]|nr:ATPase domain-containing protein [Gemmatimonadaceae bacterium]
MAKKGKRARARTDERIRLGIAGLDEVLGGGLPPNHVYLVDGDPGTGKTTVGLQFLIAGRDLGERVMYVTLSETADELRSTAASHGWSLEGVDIFELSGAVSSSLDEAYTLFHPSEVELQETVETVLDAIRKTNPTRVVIDSLSEMRLLAREPLRFRRQILALKQFFVGTQCTVVFLDDRTAPDGDMQLHSLAHGVIVLDHLAIDYGSERRRLQVKKLRGAQFRGGYHDFRILTGGLEVYPRLLTGETGGVAKGKPIISGSAELDTLLGGGLASGTSSLITGAAGTGKSVLCLQYALAAAERGERVHFYLFDERASTFRARAAGLGMPLKKAEASGNLIVRQIEPTQMSPGEFANEIRLAVDRDGMNMVVIDSINGYMQAMPSERLLTVQVHELLSYLANNHVTSLLTLVQHGVFGGPVDEAAEVSYLADTVVLLRYFEHAGAVRQAISAVKKRSGPHEHTIRECQVAKGGLKVGEPLAAFRGVLTGVPEYSGRDEPLMATPAHLGMQPVARRRPDA